MDWGEDGRCGTYLGRGSGAAWSACLDQRSGGSIGVLQSDRSCLHGSFSIVRDKRDVAWGGVVEAGRFTPGRGEGDDTITTTGAAADGDMDEGRGGATGPVKKRGIEPRT